MPALSFQGEWLNSLLSCLKQQTTRQQTTRIRVGDMCSIYNQQRRRIADKPLRRLTCRGCEAMAEREYPMIPEFHTARYYAHLLGKVEITDVYDIHPDSTMNINDLYTWARDDGFDGYRSARCWFEIHYGARWMHQTWTVIKWDGWAERYFEPETV